MREENSVTASIGGFNGRITRARAANSGARAGAPAYKEPNQVKKRVPQPRPKRAAVDQKNIIASDNQSKRRAVLQEVTNVSCDHAFLKCQDATKVQVKNNKQARIITTTKVASSDTIVIQHTQANQKAAEIDKEMLDNLALDKVKGLRHMEENISSSACGTNDRQSKMESAENPSHPQIPIIKGNKICIYEVSALPTALGIVNIDYDYKDPQLCTIYAPDIYHSLRVFERVRRPHSNFMETAQSDITQSMRAILIDWIVEVSEEYKLVPDTLYLTVYLIDWFLSQNYIERQRLQLLGITCMLIASKYEEICAPRVDEFCFITDNTYSRDEVLNMERLILKHCGFHVSVPTSKTFLRRFLRAAQASYKSPSLEVEYLANYLTELTLMDYSFLKFLPSAVAASAVFLARWTLDQASHPWDSTLEYYTFYKASDLKCTVLALQDLQLNISGCPLTAIRSKYKQQKFKSVAALSSPKLLDTLF